MTWIRVVGRICFLFFIGLVGLMWPSSAVAVGLSISPPFQYLNVINIATPTAVANPFNRTLKPETSDIDTAYITLTNHDTQSVNLAFSLAHIQATDLYGRLQFNAPLPQTILPADSTVAIINPKQFDLNPDQTATISVTFNPAAIEPDKTAYLLLAKITSPELETKDQGPGTNLTQYLSSAIIIRDPTNTIPKLEITKFPWSSIPVYFALPDFFRIQAKNSGTQAFTPRGLIQITDQFNREVMRGPINETAATLIPRSERIIYSHLQPAETAYPVFLATLRLTAYDDQHISSVILVKHFIYLNPLMGIGLILTLIAIPLLRLKRHHS